MEPTNPPTTVAAAATAPSADHAKLPPTIRLELSKIWNDSSLGEGERLKRMRSACNWKQIQIAKAAEVNPILISRAESGKLTSTSSIIRKMLQVFGVVANPSAVVRESIRVAFRPSIAAMPLWVALHQTDLKNSAAVHSTTPSSAPAGAPPTASTRSLEAHELVRALVNAEADLALLAVCGGPAAPEIVRLARILAEEFLPLAFFSDAPVDPSDCPMPLPGFLQSRAPVLLCFVKGSPAERLVAFLDPAIRDRLRLEAVETHRELENCLDASPSALSFITDPFSTEFNGRLTAVGKRARSISTPDSCFRVPRAARTITHDLCTTIGQLPRFAASRPTVTRILDETSRAVTALATDSLVDSEAIARSFQLDPGSTRSRIAAQYPGFEFLLYPAYVSLLRAP